MTAQSWHDNLSLIIILLLRFSAVDNGDLRDALMAMGAKDIFDFKKADLSGITKDLKDSESGLSLGHFIHKVKFDVLEKIGNTPAYQTGIHFARKLWIKIFW